MNCAATNKVFVRQRRKEHGMKDAVRRLSLFLDYVLSDKNRYKNIRIHQIHASIDRTIEQIEKGETSIDELHRILKEQHNAHLEFGDKTRPHGLKSDYINGVHIAIDNANIILLYVLIHLYGMGETKVNKIIDDINEAATCFNRGYITEQDIRQALRDEEGLEVHSIKEVPSNVKLHKNEIH